MQRAVAPTRELDTIHQPAIDQALRLVDGEDQRLATRLTPKAPAPRSLAQLRAGPLGQDLQRLALVADGRSEEPREQVLSAIDSVLHLLCWSAGSEHLGVPRTFWDTDLGRMLARAKYRTFAARDLVGIAAAARQLGVTRTTIYRWMDDGSLGYVRDDRSGRTYVVRQGLEQRQPAAAELPRREDDLAREWAAWPSAAGEATIDAVGVDGWEVDGGAVAWVRTP